MKGLNVDLVIWNEDDSVYRQSLHESIIDAVATSPVSGMLDRPGGVFVRRGDQMSEDDRALLQAVARVVLLDDAGTLAEQADRRLRLETPTPALRPVQRRPESVPFTEPARHDLAFFNGLGGFSQDGREYIIVLPPHTKPPPWSMSLQTRKSALSFRNPAARIPGSTTAMNFA